MQVALISDIHGNAVALDAVLAEIADVDRIVCLGDVAACGPDPSGVVDRVAELCAIVVQGNTDAEMVAVPDWWHDPLSRGLPPSAVASMEQCVWSAEQLSESQRDFLSGLPLSATANLGEALTVRFFHGSPRSYHDYLTATTPDDELVTMLAGATEGLLAGGHTHVPLLRRVGSQTLVNPGSVGMPFAEYGIAGSVAVGRYADYAIVSSEGDSLGVEFRRVGVDQAAVAASVRTSGMPHPGWYLGLRS